MPIGLHPWEGDLPRRQAALDALIVPGRVRPLRDLGPCDWQQWAADGGHGGRPAGWEGDASPTNRRSALAILGESICPARRSGRGHNARWVYERTNQQFKGELGLDHSSDDHDRACTDMSSWLLDSPGNPICWRISISQGRVFRMIC